MFYIGIICIIIFTLSKIIRLKEILDKKLELKEVDKAFLSRINN